jgi:hypothetical protein
MICSLCLEEIISGEKMVVVDDRSRHESCSKEFEEMVDELDKISSDTMDEDI